MKYLAGKILITLGIILMIFIPSSHQDAVRDTPVCVEEGEEVTITINTGEYSFFAQINETICDGWTYVNSSLDSEQLNVSGNHIRFTLIGYVPSFNYTLRAPNKEGCCIITGEMKAPYQDLITLQQSTICICNSTITPTPSPTSTSNPTPSPTSTSTSNPTPSPTSTSTSNPTSTSGTSGGGSGGSGSVSVPDSNSTNPDSNGDKNTVTDPEKKTKTPLKIPIIRKTSSDGNKNDGLNANVIGDGLTQNETTNTSYYKKDGVKKENSPGFEFLFALTCLIVIYAILRQGNR